MTLRPRRLTLLGLALATLAAAGCLSPARSEGEKLWRQRCADCHGMDGAGNTPRYMGNPRADLLDGSWEHAGGDDGGIAYVIREGIFGEMPDNQDLTADQVSELVRYLRYLRGERAAP